MSSQILVGDALEKLRELPAGLVQTVVTSPPYYGLRDYDVGEWRGGDPDCDHGPTDEQVKRAVMGNSALGTEHGTQEEAARSRMMPRHKCPRCGAVRSSWEGGDPDCDHQPATARRGLERRASTLGGGVAHLTAQELGQNVRDTCARCGARRIETQLGLEHTPELYVEKLVAIFRELRRVLRDDGTVWLNLGDSYSGNTKGSGGPSAKQDTNAGSRFKPRRLDTGAKPKDLLGIPWMVAFALRADGWYLRADVIWAKPNPMPESVRDRPTNAHEYLFLLAKQARYFYDADAIREDADSRPQQRLTPIADQPKGPGRIEAGGHNPLCQGGTDTGRNKRSVWTIPTQPFPGSHFATFPPKLVEPCILAGSAETACGTCGAPWARVVEVERPDDYVSDDPDPKYRFATGGRGNSKPLTKMFADSTGSSRTTTGFEPSCSCSSATPTGASIVLDPFSGAGTTGLVADRLGRSFIGIELSSEYAKDARRRIIDDAPLFHQEAFELG